MSWASHVSLKILSAVLPEGSVTFLLKVSSINSIRVSLREKDFLERNEVTGLTLEPLDLSLNFNNLLRWFVYTLKFEKHCYVTSPCINPPVDSPELNYEVSSLILPLWTFLLRVHESAYSLATLNCLEFPTPWKLFHVSTFLLIDKLVLHYGKKRECWHWRELC